MKPNIELRSGPYLIRTIVREDIEVMRQLRNASRTSFITSDEIGVEAQERWYEDYLARDSADLMFVAVRDGQIVGMAGLAASDGTNVAEFGRLVVAESERRRGLGYALTGRLMAWAFARGASSLVLDVLVDNAPAMALYQRLGFMAMSPKNNVRRMTAIPSGFHSVIIGSYNRPTYVRKAIRSVMDQTYQLWQIVVTDDGSTEETLDAIRSEFGSDERCSLIVTSDRLPDGPRPSGNIRAVERINDAIQHVRGDIVHYLPDDDWFVPGRFEAFNKIFEDPSVMMACGGMRYAYGTEVSPTDGIFPGADVWDPYCVLDQTQVAHRRECFATVPRWSTSDIGYAADGLFYRHLCQAGYGPIRPTPAIVSVKRRHGLNLIDVQTNATHRRE